MKIDCLLLFQLKASSITIIVGLREQIHKSVSSSCFACIKSQIYTNINDQKYTHQKLFVYLLRGKPWINDDCVLATFVHLQTLPEIQDGIT